MTESLLSALDLPADGRRPSTGASPARFVTDRRRWLQLALATIWVIDGLLQYQTSMFTRSFATQTLAPTAQGNPGWVSASILWAAHLVVANPVGADAAFATLQLLIGLAIASRRAVKPALAVSIVWSLLVWWFGEGVGGVLLPGASALTGAPGAVLLYAILAVLLWPADDPRDGSFVAAAPFGATTAKIVWFVLWGSLAALNLEPANLSGQGIHDMLAGMGSGQPAWLNAVITSFAGLSAHHGTALDLVGTVVLGLIAIGVFLPPVVVRMCVLAAVTAAAFIWVVGEALGALFGGQATDVNSGPLLALIALAYWPGVVRLSAPADPDAAPASATPDTAARASVLPETGASVTAETDPAGGVR